jgi:radical SAM protein with 4Fe4S-binding SPASM domain
MWEENVRTLCDDGHKMTLMVCLSNHLLSHYRPADVIQYAIDLGFKYILFERITINGHAQINSDLLPANSLVDAWLFEMYQDTMKHEFHTYIGNAFLFEIAESYLKGVHSGNRCRGCEKKIITINADGTVAGCPNSATNENWGNISLHIDDFLSSDKRVGAICSEKQRKPQCFSCEVNDLCNGDCYKLKWDGDICSAPKTLFKYLKKNNPIDECRKLSLV